MGYEAVIASEHYLDIITLTRRSSDALFCEMGAKQLDLLRERVALFRRAGVGFIRDRIDSVEVVAEIPIGREHEHDQAGEHGKAPSQRQDDNQACDRYPAPQRGERDRGRPKLPDLDG